MVGWSEERLEMTREERILDQAIELTEEVGLITAELGEAIELIHYDPENVTETGLQQLREIKRLVKKAHTIVGHIER